ncbi:pectinesterase family protein [Algibacillus agarilyticus]|uniref:pectinesterase family protein n=1 Tax=Algibacillus agarilyticus TaxID=2234133 RepID=UPI000DCF868B|nr:pectinesterase family protein [Algibacillus agarilyticus]
MNYKLSILSSVIGAVLVSGCGFESEQNVSAVTVTPLQGQFLDSGVGGMPFRRTNINGEVTEGVTDAEGRYEYVRGESIEFYIGGVTFPAVQAKSIITPLSFFSTNNPNAENVANVARFLQSLDSDNDPSNGITIDSALGGVATVNNDDEGNPLSAKDFFNQSGNAFAAAVETWLGQATNNTRSTLVSYEDAVSHFVATLAAELGEYKAQAFKLATLTGPITHIYVENGTVVSQIINFVPEASTDNSATKGSYTISQDDVEVASGLYELSRSRQVLMLNQTDADTDYLVSLANRSEGELYSVCNAANVSGLQTLINACETADDRKSNMLILNAELVADEVAAMQEYAATIDEPEPALFEEFEVDSVNTFYSSTYKRLAESTSSGPLYFKTGGTIEIENGELKLAGDRFSIGNAEPASSTTSADTKGTGIYNLSQGFTISFDVIDHNSSGGLSLYVDNNTTSAGNSLHGSGSKFVGSSINDENFPKGQRFSFTHDGFPATTNSFFQLRTDSAGSITIDNLKIETVASAVVKEAYEPVAFSCSDMPALYFCDDFSQGTLDNWNIFASEGNTAGPEGVFDVLDIKGNNAMRYTAGSLGGVLATVKDSAMANVPDADYFVEAKLRPRQNGTTANKHLYMLGRYVDQQNWYGGGLNLQNSSASTQSEVATLIADSLSRPVQKKQPFILGERDATDDGVWYTVRFEMLGSDLTLYINGELKGTFADTNFTAKGLAGLYTYNRSFELDDFKIGAAMDKPIQISTDLAESSLIGGVNGDPLTFNVSALLGDGSADSVTVHSGDGDIAKATIDGSTVTVNPLEEGMTAIYLVSATDPTVIQKIDITVAPQFVDSTTDYGDLTAKLSPAINEMSAYTDTLISVAFDTAPTLGENGMVRIYNANTNELVDELNVAGDLDTIKSATEGKLRNVRYQAIYVEGNKLVIKPHSGALAYGTEYYVVIGNDVALNTQLNGLDFDGLGSSTQWSFTTKSTMPTGTAILVDDDGATADFRTLQAAMAYAMTDKNASTTISIRDGVYNEILYLRDKNNLTIQGESRDGTVVQYNNYEGLNGGSSGRPVFLVESADMLVLNNFTLKNTHERSGSGDQAETIYFNSPGKRLIANNMNFVSEQDTLQLKGYTWFYNSLVAGNVDFIWGYPEAALFENTEIRTVGRSEKAPADSEGGYILQARVQEGDKDNAGFVFLNSEFTSGAGPKGNGVLDNSTYIARSGGSTSYYDNVLLINNKLGSHIINEGWATQSNTDQKQPDPNPSPATNTMGWREFGSMNANGDALDLSGRDPLASVLTSAPFNDRAGVFSNYGAGSGWDPQPLAIPDFTNLPTDGSDGGNNGGGDVISTPAMGDGGFAGDNYTLTGGEGGTVVTVATGTALVAALDAAKSAGSPSTIYIDGTITAANTGNATRNIGIKDIKDITIVGVADRGEFNGIGLQIERAQNVIIRNLKMHEVPKDFGDVIGIEGDENVGTSRIWIDHNELYGSLAVDKDFYDGLIDSRSGASHITISYNYIHDHWKTMLNGSSDDDAGDRYITYHHNHFANINSRVPLFRYGFGHLYNNYFVNINGSVINSRMGAQLLIENNVFEDVKNPIVSIDSREVGYWYARGNSFEGTVTYSDNDTFGSTEDSYSISGAITGTYDDVSYDYATHLLDTADVKAHVKAHAGIGKIDQSNDTIPAVDAGTGGNDGGSGSDANTGTPNLATAYVESFSATDADAFFTSAYRDIEGGSDGSKDPMYSIATGGSRIFVTNGALEMTGARFSVGNTVTTSTTDADTATTGVLDLSSAYTVSFKVTAVGGTTTKGFQIYVDNNTSGSGNSIHGSASKFYSAALDDLVVGQTYTVDGLVATSTSFITLRTETDATITIDDLKIEKKSVELANSGAVDLTTPYVEVFSAVDATAFFTSTYRDITAATGTDGTNAAMYRIATGGSRIFVTNGALEMTGARFSIGNTIDTSTTSADTTTTGVLDLSADYTVSFNVVSVGGTTTKGFQIYVDNNTSGSGNSIHGSASKFYSTVLDDLVVGDTYTVDGLTATATSFLTFRTETDATITIDNVVISKK